MSDNFWIGDNELVIRFADGQYVVLEKYEECQRVFNGTYEQCRGYCETRRRDYEESIVG